MNIFTDFILVRYSHSSSVHLVFQAELSPPIGLRSSRFYLSQKLEESSHG